MSSITKCPLTGGQCNKANQIHRIPDTFFIAEAFSPEDDRQKREQAIQTALNLSLGLGSEKQILLADKKQNPGTLFCDICKLIQQSSYGIVDITGKNPNVLLELGMMMSLGKPVFVLIKKNEKESIRKSLPSDILWKRVIIYEEFIDIISPLAEQIKNRPSSGPPISPSKLLTEYDIPLDVDPQIIDDLKGRWHCKWFNYNYETRKQEPYSDDIINIYLIDAREGDIYGKGDSAYGPDANFRIEGRASRRKFVYLLYSSPPKDRFRKIIGNVILQLKPEEHKLKGWWLGTGFKNDLVGGETIWIKADYDEDKNFKPHSYHGNEKAV